MAQGVRVQTQDDLARVGQQEEVPQEPETLGQPEHTRLVHGGESSLRQHPPDGLLRPQTHGLVRVQDLEVIHVPLAVLAEGLQLMVHGA